MNCKRHCLLFLYHAWLTLFMITSRLIQPSLIHYCEGNRGRLDSQWQLFRDGQLELKWLISVFCIQCSLCRRTWNVPYLSWCAWFCFTLDFGHHQSIVGYSPYSVTQLHLGQFKTWPKKWHLSINLSLPGISTSRKSTTIQEGFLSNQLPASPKEAKDPRWKSCWSEEERFPLSYSTWMEQDDSSVQRMCSYSENPFLKEAAVKLCREAKCSPTHRQNVPGRNWSHMHDGRNCNVALDMDLFKWML